MIYFRPVDSVIAMNVPGILRLAPVEAKGKIKGFTRLYIRICDLYLPLQILLGKRQNEIIETGTYEQKDNQQTKGFSSLKCQSARRSFVTRHAKDLHPFSQTPTSVVGIFLLLKQRKAHTTQALQSRCPGRIPAQARGPGSGRARARALWFTSGLPLPHPLPA